MKEMKLMTASWCGPCMVLKRRLTEQKLTPEYVDIDTEEGRALSIKYTIRSVPTLLVIDGDTHEQIKGIEDIINALKEEEKASV